MDDERKTVELRLSENRQAARRAVASATSPSHERAAPAVDWHPWGDPALARASRENRPVLLSIGYGAGHGCRVMDSESFADAGTAVLMNEGFVCIRIDREERPDIDLVYQQAHQLLRRGPGGWPLTAFLSPRGVPFHSAVYFPAEAQSGQTAFRDLPFKRQIADALLLRFEDVVAGGFWFTPHDAPPLIHRPKTGLDAATPSGIGTAARRCVTVFAPIVRGDPAGHAQFLQAGLSA